MKRFFSCLICYLLLSLTITTVAQTDCPTLVEFALNTASESCADTGRNEACFGHVNLTAEAQPDADTFDFGEIGDIVDVAAIQSLRLSTFDSQAGAWGVVLMRVQANLPDTVPGQNVTFMLFGDTEIRNAASSVQSQKPPSIDAQVSSSINANVRVGPDQAMAVLDTVPTGTTVTATGVSPNGEWMRIILPESETGRQGWIASQLLIPSGDINTLNVIEPSEPQFGPMQAFYLSTGIGTPSCDEVPDNGLLVQTPKGVGEINLLVNEVEISMGSTVFLTADRDPNRETDDGIIVNSMKVKTIEGTAITRLNGETQVALGGSQFEVMYDDFGEIEAVTETIRLIEDEIDDLPFDQLERDIEAFEELTDEELDILDEYDELFDVVDIDDTDELLDHIEEFGDDGLLEFLQEDLDIDYFDADTAEFFEDELGFDIEGFDDFEEDFGEFDEDFGEFDDFEDFEDDDFSDDGFEDDDFDDDDFSDDDFEDDDFSDEDFEDDGGGEED